MTDKIRTVVHEFIGQYPEIVQIIIDLIDQHPALESNIPDILKAYLKLIRCFESGHTFFICGNGGSFADAMHISAEMLKSFTHKRKLSAADKGIFKNLPYERTIKEALEYGFPTIVLGLNHSLFTALENDNPERYIGFAQELYVLAKADDVLMGISTSGRAKNVLYAVITARAKGLTTIGLTGEDGGELAQLVDIAIKVPTKSTSQIQELHLPVYHTLCALVEAYFITKLRLKPTRGEQ